MESKERTSTPAAAYTVRLGSCFAQKMSSVAQTSSDT
jgi:hypothetical protein